MPASYNGVLLFGLAVRMRMVPGPLAEQRVSFFGIEGQMSLYGGGRGRSFSAEGVLFGETLADLNDAEDAILNYRDGIARVLVDTRGRAWDQVLLMSYQPGPKILQDPRGFFLPYTMTLAGLI